MVSIGRVQDLDAHEIWRCSFHTNSAVLSIYLAGNVDKVRKGKTSSTTGYLGLYSQV